MVQTPPPSRTAFRNHRATAHQQRSTTHTHAHTQQSTAPSSSTFLLHSTAPANLRPLKIPRVIQRENKKRISHIICIWLDNLSSLSVCLSVCLSVFNTC